MPSDYSLQELASLADVTPRTVRYYISVGLLNPPEQLGPGARYPEGTLQRLRLIKTLQRQHLPLAEIRARLAELGEAEMKTLAETVEQESPPGSAIDYIRSVLSKTTGHQHPVTQHQAPAALQAPWSAHRIPGPEGGIARSSSPERSQWERIVLSADIELHVRRPLSLTDNRRLERLLSAARAILEGENP